MCMGKRNTLAILYLSIFSSSGCGSETVCESELCASFPFVFATLQYFKFTPGRAPERRTILQCPLVHRQECALQSLTLTLTKHAYLTLAKHACRARGCDPR